MKNALSFLNVATTFAWISALALGVFACSTSQLSTAKADAQQVATIVRQVENWTPTPAEFNLYYELLTKGNATAQANKAKVEAKYAEIYNSGKPTLDQIEAIAAQFDAK